MPTYEYACKDCGNHLEVVQSFSDDPLTECPGCGGNLRKVFGAVGISFKGSGFYKTDSRSSSSTVTKPSGDKGSGDASSGDKGSADKASDSSASTSGSSEKPSSSPDKAAS